MDNQHVNASQQRRGTRTRAYQNYDRRSYSSFDVPSSNNNYSFNKDDQHEQEKENDEQIDTIQPEDEHPRSRSTSLTKARKQSRTLQTPLGRSSSSHQQKHSVESLQLNDDRDDDDDDDDDGNNIDYVGQSRKVDELELEEEQQRKATRLPPIKVKGSMDQDTDGKYREIRELRSKLSRRDEESKKQISELQSKQSRLENAIKLLAKQTSNYGKQIHNNAESKFSILSLFILCRLILIYIR